jgi:hypothetical protein
MALKQWGDKYMAEEGCFVITRHRDCGGEIGINVACERCGAEVGARDAYAEPGPGLKAV